MKLFPRKGIPVVAYVSLDKQVAPPCNLFIHHAPDEKELTFRLQFRLDDDQSYGLLYHADNLDRRTALLNMSMRLPDIAVAQLARTHSHSSDMKNLFLSLKQTCTIQCELDQVVAPPRPGKEQSYRAFLDLAKATTVNISFDYKWMQDCVSLSHVINELPGLHGCPVNEKHLRIVDRRTLAVVDIEPPLVQGDQPPAYSATPPHQHLATLDNQPATAINAPTLPKPAKEHTALLPKPKPAPPATPAPFAKPKPGGLNSRADTSTTPSATLPQALTNANASTNPDLSAYAEKLGNDLVEHANHLRNDMVRHAKRLRNDMVQHAKRLRNDTLDHANHLRSAADDRFKEMLDHLRSEADDDLKDTLDHIRSEADDDLKDTIDNYTMVLQDEKDQAIASVKSAIDDLCNEFADKRAQSLLDMDDDIAQFRTDLLHEMQTCRDKSDANPEAHATELPTDARDKVPVPVPPTPRSVPITADERLELQLLAEREKLLEDEYRDRRDVLRRERELIEAHWGARRELHGAKARVLKRQYDDSVGS